MKFTKVQLFATLPLIFALSGCATTEENTPPAAAAPSAVTPSSTAAAAPATAAPVVAVPEVKPAHCENHQAAIEAIKHDCAQHCKKAKGKKARSASPTVSMKPSVCTTVKHIAPTIPTAMIPFVLSIARTQASMMLSARTMPAVLMSNAVIMPSMRITVRSSIALNTVAPWMLAAVNCTIANNIVRSIQAVTILPV